MKHFVIVMAVVFLLSHRLAGEDLTEVERIQKFTTTKLTGYKSWTADYIQTMSAMGAQMNITGDVQCEPPKKMRMEIALEMMGQPMTMTMVMGEDQIMWQDMHMGGQRQVMKMDMSKIGPATAAKFGLGGDPAQNMDPVKQWEHAQQLYSFTALPAAELHGQTMHVLEGTLKPGALTNHPAAAMLGKLRMHIGQADGFTHQIEMFDKAGTAVVMRQEFTNLKFNETLPAETFTFTPPTGVPVVDMTDMVIQMQGATSPAGK